MNDKAQIKETQDSEKGIVYCSKYLIAFIASIFIYQLIILPNFKSINNSRYYTCIDNARENSYKCEDICFDKLSQCRGKCPIPGDSCKESCSKLHDKRCYSSCTRAKNERIISL
ncbi:hypothetical protein CONCODRAFT_12815 [Conidiobolus coronatus NRRL 28638]|uniref:Uncharacterized protein n=1 Tax=Conidiobolus coronatus (strain ATCC 28846 / CBS 209.66 / NRRL 28638) TaxID=796925 RepID=A0A137NS34_CONC2|nr:hypothetical protein CONCODRAFT_12815 [Conidiobolus coronatus NRRL 28638]|eukprot:KXN65558.1 hypothetical protein CONCODRAFT_12815 [Conidiobolus coronatus NRRL 28638]